MNWLENLKPGDKVILNSGFNDKYVVAVKRTTKTHVIIERKVATGKQDEQKFSKIHGNLVGGYGYNSPWISEPTPEKIVEIRTNNERRRIINKISEFNFKKLSLEYLFMIEDVLKQVENE